MANSWSLNDLESYFYNNENQIRKRMKQYDYNYNDIANIRNPIDLSNILDIDSRLVRNVAVDEYAEYLADLLQSDNTLELKESMKMQLIRLKVLKEATPGDYKSDKKELIDMIYDTLLKNTQWPQLNVDLIEDPELNRGSGNITFVYDEIPVNIKIVVG